MNPRLALGLLCTLAACDDTPPIDLPPREDCALAVVASDYSSTSISLLTADGSLCAPDILTSGSRPPGLLTALSGDIDLPAEASPGTIFLLDRYPNAVLTALDPDPSTPADDGVLWQANVSAGFAGNPQDLARLPEGLLVARMERDPTDTIGSDLLYLPLPDPARAPTAAVAVSLQDFVDPPIEVKASNGTTKRIPFDAMPTRFARAAGTLWVGLTHLLRDFSVAGSGRVLGLAMATSGSEAPVAVAYRLEIPALGNCGKVAAASPDGGLWVACAGLFREPDPSRRLGRSGLAYLAPEVLARELAATSPVTLAPTWTATATTLTEALGPAPLGLSLAAIDERRVLVVAIGDGAAKRPDRLLWIDRGTSPATVVALAEADAFTLGDILLRPTEGLVLVPDANLERPRLRRFTWPTDAGATTELAPVVVSPTGLPPRHVAPFR
jgi:hypothetical protein